MIVPCSSKFPKGTNLRSPPWKTGLNFLCFSIFSRDYPPQKSLQPHHSACKGKFCGFKDLLRCPWRKILLWRLGSPNPAPLIQIKNWWRIHENSILGFLHPTTTVIGWLQVLWPMSRHHLNQKRKGCKTSTMHSKWVKPWNHLPSPETNSLLAPENSLSQKEKSHLEKTIDFQGKNLVKYQGIVPTIEDLGFQEGSQTNPRFRWGSAGLPIGDAL